MKDVINGLRGDIDKINRIDGNTILAGKPAHKVDFTFKADPNKSVELIK
jgi:hypothetical protein